MWQREMAAVIFGTLFGFGFWVFGFFALGMMRALWAGKKVLENLLFFLVGLPFGTGVILGIPLVCGWMALTVAEQQPELDDWLAAGFFSWPVVFAAMKLWVRRQARRAAAEAEKQRLVELSKHFLTIQRQNEWKIWERRLDEEMKRR